MNILLIFFALPLATIIISIALQKILKCPTLVAAIIFAIFLIVTFIISNTNFLIAVIIYTIISYITAVIICVIQRYLSRMQNNGTNRNGCCCNSENNTDLLTISSNGRQCQCNCNCNNSSSDPTVINGVIRIGNNNNNGNSCCNCNNGQDNFSARVNVIPNTSDNGRSGCICGRYRRRDR